jgi:excisionase family DNA binding protein
MSGQEYIRVKEAARILAISPETLRQYAASGRLDGRVRYTQTAGGHRRYSREDVSALQATGGIESLCTETPANNENKDMSHADRVVDELINNVTKDGIICSMENERITLGQGEIELAEMETMITSYRELAENGPLSYVFTASGAVIIDLSERTDSSN